MTNSTEKEMGAAVVTDASWAEEVERSDVPVLVDFWAPWCGPCRQFAPTIDALADEHRGRAKVMKLNVDENPGLAAKFGIRTIPTLIFFRGGEVVEEIRGRIPRPEIDARLRRLSA